MPLQDLLGELSTLSQLQHQRMADALAAQVQQSNMDIAHATMISVLPTPDARAAFNSHDWGSLAAILPESTDTLRELALGNAAKKGFDPVAANEGLTKLIAGEGQGDLAKSGLEAQAFNSAPTNFSQDLPALFRSVVTSHLTGQGAAGFAVDKAIAADPKMVASMAADQAGTGVSAAQRFQGQVALSTNAATVGANVYGTQAQERIAMASQGLEMAKMQLMKAQARNAGSDKAVEYLRNMETAVAALNTGGLDPVGQVANTQIYNANVQRLIDEGVFSQDAAGFANPEGTGGGMMLPSGSTGMAGGFKREVQKIITGHKP